MGTISLFEALEDSIENDELITVIQNLLDGPGPIQSWMTVRYGTPAQLWYFRWYLGLCHSKVGCQVSSVREREVLGSLEPSLQMLTLQ